MKTAAAIVACVLFSRHFLYHLVTDDPEQKQVWFYVLGGLSYALAWFAAAYATSRYLAQSGNLTVWARLFVVLCFFNGWEELKIGVCGIDSYGILVTKPMAGLCSQKYGSFPTKTAQYLVELVWMIYYLKAPGHAKQK